MTNARKFAYIEIFNLKRGDADSEASENNRPENRPASGTSWRKQQGGGKRQQQAPPPADRPQQASAGPGSGSTGGAAPKKEKVPWLDAWAYIEEKMGNPKGMTPITKKQAAQLQHEAILAGWETEDQVARLVEMHLGLKIEKLPFHVFELVGRLFKNYAPKDVPNKPAEPAAAAAADPAAAAPQDVDFDAGELLDYEGSGEDDLWHE